MALLCLVTLRLLFTDNAYALAILALGVTSLYAYSKYLKTKEVAPLSTEVRKELEAMRSQISSISVKNNIKPQPSANQKFF